MSSDKASKEDSRRRHSSVAPMPLNSVFTRGSCSPFPSPISTTASQDHNRLLSISTFGLSGISPSQASSFSYVGRRGSTSSIGSAAIDESAIEEDDIGRCNSVIPFTRRVSLGAQAIRNGRGGISQSTIGESSGFSLSEQLKTRAEISVNQNRRPSLSSNQSTERSTNILSPQVDIPAPSCNVAPSTPTRSRQKEPDPFQERILKGDFYID